MKFIEHFGGKASEDNSAEVEDVAGTVKKFIKEGFGTQWTIFIDGISPSILREAFESEEVKKALEEKLKKMIKEGAGTEWAGIEYHVPEDILSQAFESTEVRNAAINKLKELREEGGTQLLILQDHLPREIIQEVL